MAVSFIAAIKRWQGLSTDDKPASVATDIPEGSTFHSVDTGEMWVYHQGMWELDRRLAALTDVF